MHSSTRTIRSIALILLFISALPSAAEPTRRKLEVAVPMAFTGIAAQQAENMRRGIELAKDDLEKQGWIVDLAYEDTTASSMRVVSSVQFLISQGKRLFIGPTWSYMVAAAKPLLEKAGAVTISPGTSSEVTGGPSPHIFNGTPKFSGELSAATEWLRKYKVKTAAIIVADAPWGQLHRGVYRRACTEAGVNILLDQTYPLDSEDNTITALMPAVMHANPEVALVDLNKNGAAIFIKKLGELNIKSKVLATHKLREIFDLKLAVKETVRNIIAIFEIPISKEYVEHYAKRYGEKPEQYSDSAYDALMLLAKAVENTDGSPEQVRQFLRTMKPFAGYSGKFTFDENGDTNRATWQVLELL